ncbi:sugar ABC transporter substrate-binding protein [Modestobacter roseus]|uniref:Ribose transport system substrate-binding protein n=1 Tax=Modestobacter roseus TaxID=1181884 RepID=A0A562INZ9_9ACTN|nr:sugar ABC transporter substrate-binding protein [Modestobacter roseus]MQA34422.1 substrate-binding domain-containing protein [Modestobacter roseus]TWH72749.1 ribose transport system substrate-binding protein [Modestobacter roseus]
MSTTGRRATVAAVVPLTLTLTLAGCSTTTETGTGAAPSSSDGGTTEVDTILFDFPFTSLPIYSVLSGQLADYAAEQGVTVEFTNDNSDLSTQVSNLTTYLNSDVDAVVSFPMDPASVESLAQQYMDAGKYWVTYAGDMDNQSSTLQFSFEESGRMLAEDAAQWAAENLDGAPKVLVLEDQLTQIGQERTRGIVEGLAEAAPDAEIVAQQQAVTPQDALTVTNSVLAANPDVDIVLAAVGDAAQGAYQALLSTGRAADDPETYVGGLDGNLSLFQEMQKGNMVRGVVTVKSEDIVKATIDIPLALGRGEEPETDVPVYLVTPDSPDLQEYITAFGG